jgi:hypothetical protein
LVKLEIGQMEMIKSEEQEKERLKWIKLKWPVEHYQID